MSGSDTPRPPQDQPPSPPPGRNGPRRPRSAASWAAGSTSGGDHPAGDPTGDGTARADDGADPGAAGPGPRPANRWSSGSNSSTGAASDTTGSAAPRQRWARAAADVSHPGRAGDTDAGGPDRDPTGAPPGPGRGLRPPTGALPGSGRSGGATGATSAAASTAGAAASTAAGKTAGIDPSALTRAAAGGARDRGAAGAVAAAGTEAATQGLNAAAASVGVPAAVTERITRSKPVQKLLGGTANAAVAVWVKAVSAALVLLLLAGIGAAVTVGGGFGAGDPYVWNAPMDTAAKTVPAGYLDAYVDAGRRHNVPWTILAAVGQTASAHGQVNPYVTPPPTFLAPVAAAPAGPVGEIVIVGDSLTVAAEGPLNEAFSEAGVPVQIIAEVGKSTAWGVEQVLALPPGSGRGYVVALGTNDDRSNPAGFADRITAMMRAVNGAPVVWLTLDLPGDDALNAELRAAAGRFPNLTVADWEAAAAAQGAEQYDDGIHYTPAGSKIRARFIMANLPGGSGTTPTGSAPAAGTAASVTGPGALPVPPGDCPTVAETLAGRPGQGVGPLLLLPNRLRDLGLEADPVALQNSCAAADALAAALAAAADAVRGETGQRPESLIGDARDGDQTAIAEIAGFWAAALERVPVIGSTTSLGCAAPPVGGADPVVWTVHVVGVVWGCELLDGDPPRRVVDVTVAADGAVDFREAADVTVAVDATVAEAEQVAWAWSRFGQDRCDADAEYAGVFPLTAAQFRTHAGDLAARGRCDPEANITAAARLFAAGERVAPQDRPGGRWAALAGGWAPFAGVLGDEAQRARFLESGPVRPGPLPADCKTAADAVARQVAADPATVDLDDAALTGRLADVVADLAADPVCEAGLNRPDVAYWDVIAELVPREAATVGDPAEATAPVADPQLERVAVAAQRRAAELAPAAPRFGRTPLLSRLAVDAVAPSVPAVGTFGVPDGQTNATQWVNLAVQLGGLYDGDVSAQLAAGAGMYGSMGEFGNVGPNEPFAAVFNAVGAETGVDPRLLLAVAIQESNVTLDSKCDRGGPGYGIMQKENDPSVCGSAERQIREGARMLADLYDKAGDWRGAMWGYNNGAQFATKWREVGSNIDAARAYALSWYCSPEGLRFGPYSGGCAWRADVAIWYISEDPAHRSAWRTYLELKQKYPSAVIAAVQTTVGATGCPANVPAGTLRSGAESVGAQALCARSVAQAATPEAAMAIMWAFNRLGTPYACMGMPNQMSARLGPNYYDCSSLTSSAYKYGANLPGVIVGSTRNMFPWDGVPLDRYYQVIDPAQARPGDLGLQTSCFTPPCSYQHVVMILADGYQLHTNSCGDVAHVTRWAGPSASNFAGVRRVNPALAR